MTQYSEIYYELHFPRRYIYLNADLPKQLQYNTDDVEVAGDRGKNLRPLDFHRHRLARALELRFVHLQDGGRQGVTGVSLL